MALHNSIFPHDDVMSGIKAIFKFLDIEYEINPTRISDDKIFTLQLIEIDSSGISRGLDKLEIDHASKQDIYEIPTDKFNFSFSIIDRTKLIVEAIL